MATDSDRVTSLKATLDALANAQSYEVRGRRLTRMNPLDALRLRSAMEWRVERSTDETGGMGLVEFGEPL